VLQNIYVVITCHGFLQRVTAQASPVGFALLVQPGAASSTLRLYTVTTCGQQHQVQWCFGFCFSHVLRLLCSLRMLLDVQLLGVVVSCFA
jgi:hypothetical protein